MLRVRSTKDESAGLTMFFLRASPIRAAGAIAATVALVLMAILVVLQSLQLSGEQRADWSLGSAEHALQTGSSVRAGDSGAEVDVALRSAVIKAGGSRPSIQYLLLGDLEIDGSANLTVAYEENPWDEQPFPERMLLQSGHWPRDATEVTVSVSLSTQFPTGSQVSLFGGRWKARVVGVAKDDFARDAQVLFAAPGTWNALEAIDEASAARYGSSASRNLFWRGGDPREVVEAVSTVLSGIDAVVPGDRALSGDELFSRMQSRSSVVSAQSSSLIEFRLGSLLAPFLAAITGVLIAARFISRTRSVMLAIGMERAMTRRSASAATIAFIVLGVLAGSVLGTAAGIGLRPLLEQVSSRALGPVHDVAPTIVSILIASLAGAGVAALLGVRRKPVPARARARRNDSHAHYLVLPLVAIMLMGAGFLLGQLARSTDQIIVAGLCFAGSGVVLLPLALEAVLRRDPVGMPTLLAVRRLRADIRQSGWIATMIAALLVISFGSTTLITSAIATMNGSNRATVPEAQVHFSPPVEVPSPLRESLVTQVEQYLAASSVTFSVALGGVDILDGSTVVIEDIPTLEALTDVELSQSERDLLEGGGTVRTKRPEYSQVHFEMPDGSVVVLPSSTNELLEESFGIYDGFILQTTANANNMASGLETHAFLGVSEEQIERAQSASSDLGFDSEWLILPEAPDSFAEPVEARIAALTLSMLAVIVMVFFALSVTRLLRPNLSTLRAVGAGRWWAYQLIAVQTGVVLTVAMLGAAFAATLGMFAAILVSGLAIHLVAPWQSIGIAILTVVVGSAAAITIATARLTNVERFETT